MKIGLVCPYPLDIPGGVREHVLGLYGEFKKRGHKVKIIFPGGLRKKSKKKDIIFLGIYLKIPSNKDQATITFCSNFAQKIQKMLEKEKFDIIHFHEFYTPFSSLQILQHSTSINIATFHACLEASPLAKTAKSISRTYLKKMAKKIHGAIAVSTVARKYAIFPNKRKIIIIPNGVDLTRFNTRVSPLRKFADKKINILFVGRLTKRKGLIYLLKAFKVLKKKYPNIRLIVVGDGDQKRKAKEFVRLHRVKDVFFAGAVSDKLLPFYYASADIFCSPATEAESFGIVLLEAMATGLPVVAFANTGYKQVLKGFGERGLVPSKNVKSLAGKIESLIEGKELRKDLAAWGQKEVKKYSWKKVSSRVLAFYKITQNNYFKHKI